MRVLPMAAKGSVRSAIKDNAHVEAGALLTIQGAFADDMQPNSCMPPPPTRYLATNSHCKRFERSGPRQIYLSIEFSCKYLY